jgi:hypothetical protein
MELRLGTTWNVIVRPRGSITLSGAGAGRVTAWSELLAFRVVACGGAGSPRRSRWRR